MPGAGLPDTWNLTCSFLSRAALGGKYVDAMLRTMQKVASKSQALRSYSLRVRMGMVACLFALNRALSRAGEHLNNHALPLLSSSQVLFVSRLVDIVSFQVRFHSAWWPSNYRERGMSACNYWRQLLDSPRQHRATIQRCLWPNNWATFTL